MSNFQGNIDGHLVIPGTYTATGGTTNFNIAYPPRNDRGIRRCTPFSTVPFAPDPDFVDRPELLAWVCEKCARPGARAALVGLGGVGKSQLAIQYAHKIRDTSRQTFVFWVHGNTKARFEQAYRALADRLELPQRHDPKVDVLQLVSTWLCDETNGEWKMILDNVDDVETFTPGRQRGQENSSISLAAYLPNSRNGSILITSRSKDAAFRLAGGYQNIKEVFAMDQHQGLKLLRSRLQSTSSEDGATDLLHALDYMPLAITQAAAYINRRARMTIIGYLDEFRSNDRKKESLLNWDAGDLRRDENASNSVVTTWQMSFERIREERPSATDLLSLMSCFNPQDIPEHTLRNYSRSFTGIDSEIDPDSEFNMDLDLLQAYSLITANIDTDVYDMHPLVQFCTRVWLSSISDVERWKRNFIQLIAGEFPDGEFENWTQCQRLLPHVEPLFNTEPTADESRKAWALLCTNAAWYMHRKGSYKTAQEIAVKALAAQEKVLGFNEEPTLVTVTILALVLQHQGKYDEAEKLNQRALEEREKKLGIYHPDTLMSVSNLALVLQDQGKYDEAEKLNRRALEGREKELGIYHPDTLMSMNNLALVLQYQGKYDEAEKLNRRALEGREKKLGIYHPDTLMSMDNLALVLQKQGKYNKAEKLNQRALEGWKKELGIYHPDTLISVNNLALVLRYQGKYDEAEKLNQRTLEGREKELGVHHPDTLMSVSNLALVLQDQGKYDEAEKLNQRALEEREKELGIYHPDTLMSVSNLASVLQDQGKYDEAEKLNQRALEGREKELGVHHPDTLMSVSNLASVLWDQGKYDEAEKLSQRALEGREKELGVHHPDTLTSVHWLAYLSHKTKRYAEAAELYQRAYSGRAQILGPQHPDTIACGNHFSELQKEADQARRA